MSTGVQAKVAVARKADALIEAGGEGGERLRLHHVSLEAFSTVYSFCALLAGYEGSKWYMLSTKAAEDEVLNLRDPRGGTILHWAAQSHCAAADESRLAQHKSRAKLAGVLAARDAVLVNARDDAGCTPLHDAAENGREAVARALLAAGADTKAEDCHGQTPLSYAREGRHAALVALLS